MNEKQTENKEEIKRKCKKATFLRRTDSGKKPVTSSVLGTKLWLSCFLSFLRAFTISDNDFLGLVGRENEEEEEERWEFRKMKELKLSVTCLANMVVVVFGGGLERR